MGRGINGVIGKFLNSNTRAGRHIGETYESILQEEQQIHWVGRINTSWSTTKKIKNY